MPTSGVVSAPSLFSAGDAGEEIIRNPDSMLRSSNFRFPYFPAPANPFRRTDDPVFFFPNAVNPSRHKDPITILRNPEGNDLSLFTGTRQLRPYTDVWPQYRYGQAASFFSFDLIRKSVEPAMLRYNIVRSVKDHPDDASLPILNASALLYFGFITPDKLQVSFSWSGKRSSRIFREERYSCNYPVLLREVSVPVFLVNLIIEWAGTPKSVPVFPHPEDG